MIMTDEELRRMPTEEIRARLGKSFGEVADLKSRMIGKTQQAIDEDWTPEKLRDERATDKQRVDVIAVDVQRMQAELERRQTLPRA